MKLNPITRELFTDQGHYLKTLSCPLKKQWQQMTPLTTTKRLCDSCSKTVQDTANMTDQDLTTLLKQNPTACLKVTITKLQLTPKTLL